MCDLNPAFPSSGTCFTRAQSVNQTAGVKLEVSLNGTRLVDSPSQNTSDTILVSMTEYNILPYVNNLTAGNNWPLENLTVGGCDFHEPFGIAVFRGNYTSENISKASSIDLFPVLMCPVGSLPSEYYTFEPNSDFATIITSPYFLISPTDNTTAVRQTYASQPVTDNIPLNGYCCKQIPLGGGPFTIGLIPFAAGIYTLATGDMWGDLTILHFTVSVKD